jgi:hypothetical protein
MNQREKKLVNFYLGIDTLLFYHRQIILKIRKEINRLFIDLVLYN